MKIICKLEEIEISKTKMFSRIIGETWIWNLIIGMKWNKLAKYIRTRLSFYIEWELTVDISDIIDDFWQKLQYANVSLESDDKTSIIKWNAIFDNWFLEIRFTDQSFEPTIKRNWWKLFVSLHYDGQVNKHHLAWKKLTFTDNFKEVNLFL